jgi:hypothetical protein
MLVPSSSERRCCKSNQRAWTKAGRSLRQKPPPPGRPGAAAHPNMAGAMGSLGWWSSQAVWTELPHRGPRRPSRVAECVRRATSAWLGQGGPNPC